MIYNSGTKLAIIISKLQEMANINNPKIFIVDDDAHCRMRYQRHLASLGFNNNLLFDNGDDCLKNLDAHPDVIFLDYDMKPLNGIDILHKVKQHNPNIHILFISGIKDMNLAVNAIQRGAFDYIYKGDKDLDSISEAITKILRMRQFYATLREFDLMA
jgi:DNA-binding NtrC family response regulator